jgi:hypothetical protein
MYCSLCRSGRTGRDAYKRAKQRQVDWPSPQQSIKNPVSDPIIPTSLEDAFDTISQYMRMTSRQCKRYHASNEPCDSRSSGDYHCRRYHGDNFITPVIKNPINSLSKDHIHVKVVPGNYSITAAREKGNETSHVVHLEEGQAVNISLSLR